MRSILKYYILAAYIAPYNDGIYFDSLPIVGSCNELADRRGLKFSFYKIPGIVSGKIEMEDVTINIGFLIIRKTVLQSSDYVAVILYTAGRRLWVFKEINFGYFYLKVV